MRIDLHKHRDDLILAGWLAAAVALIPAGALAGSCAITSQVMVP